jgi:hypothetical protein
MTDDEKRYWEAALAKLDAKLDAILARLDAGSDDLFLSLGSRTHCKTRRVNRWPWSSPATSSSRSTCSWMSRPALGLLASSCAAKGQHDASCTSPLAAKPVIPRRCEAGAPRLISTVSRPTCCRRRLLAVSSRSSCQVGTGMVVQHARRCTRWGLGEWPNSHRDANGRRENVR